MSYIRPKLKTRVVNELYHPQKVLPGTYGRVGLVCDAMSKSVQERPDVWVPPLNYEWLAKKLGLGPAYVARCKEWYDTHQIFLPAKLEGPVIDPAPILQLMKKYSKKGPPLFENGPPLPTSPPLHQVVVAWECAGYSKQDIEMAAARYELKEAQMDTQQDALDKIFSKYKSASKSTPKTAKKIIKAVKKKMR